MTNISVFFLGVSRALPFAQLNEDVMNQINELYKAAHHTKMNTAVRAFCILFQVSKKILVSLLCSYIQEGVPFLYFVCLFCMFS